MQIFHVETDQVQSSDMLNLELFLLCQSKSHTHGNLKSLDTHPTHSDGELFGKNDDTIPGNVQKECELDDIMLKQDTF